MNTRIIYFQIKDFHVPFSTLQSITLKYFAKIMRESCFFCCSSCISFNPTSHLKMKSMLLLNTKNLVFLNTKNAFFPIQKMYCFQIRRTFNFEYEKCAVFKYEKRSAFKYEKCSIFKYEKCAFSNTKTVLLGISKTCHFEILNMYFLQI